MSLKAFHIFFVAVSTLLCCGLGGFAVRDYAAQSAWPSLVFAILAFAAAAALLTYGGWFLRKLKHVSFL